MAPSKAATLRVRRASGIRSSTTAGRASASDCAHPRQFLTAARRRRWVMPRPPGATSEWSADGNMITYARGWWESFLGTLFFLPPFPTRSTRWRSSACCSSSPACLPAVAARPFPVFPRSSATCARYPVQPLAAQLDQRRGTDAGAPSPTPSLGLLLKEPVAADHRWLLANLAAACDGGGCCLSFVAIFSSSYGRWLASAPAHGGHRRGDDGVGTGGGTAHRRGIVGAGDRSPDA